MPDRYCEECGKSLGDTVHKNRKYCSKICRDAASRNNLRKERIAKERQTNKPVVSKAIKDLRKLAKYSGEEDPAVIFRETLTEVVRENATQYVQDNLLGAGEALTNLLPKVMAGLAMDLDSKDDFVRTRAQAAVLKYAMEFKDTKKKDEDLGVIQVVHNVALPNTPLGHRIEEEIIELDERAITEQSETFEHDWPRCHSCGERKHPDAVHRDGTSGDGETPKFLCSSCSIKKSLRQGRDPSAMFTRDPEFGRPDPVREED